MEERARRPGPVRRLFERRPWTVDVALGAGVTVVAAVLRLVQLGEVPFGLHPDEAQLGLDAHRVMREGWIGVYTDVVLGQPAGHSYFAVPFVAMLGDTTFAVRLPMMLLGLAAVPMLFALVRVTLGRTEATFAALLLAISYWHLLYSRIAHWSISYGTVLLASLLVLFLAMQRRSALLWALAGALLGLGVYTYNIYPIAVVAVAVFLAIVTVTRWRAGEWSLWWPQMVVFWSAALIVALPMLAYISDPDAFYWDHVRNYSDVGVRESDEYRSAGTWGKIELLAGQAKIFASAYAWGSVEDIVDGNGIRPMFDPLLLLLIGAGVAIAIVRYRREPVVIAALCCVAIIPLPAVLQQGSIMRQPVGAAPFAMLLAALPLAWIWRSALASEGWRRWLQMLAAGGAVAVIGVTTVHDYFWTWKNDELVRFVYHAEITSASEYMRDLPEGAYVYFYSDRHPLGLETRQFLAPDVRGEDRSREFSLANGSIEDITEGEPAVFVLLDVYLPLLPEIEERYPGGRALRFEHDHRLMFYAYELPSAPSAAR